MGGGDGGALGGSTFGPAGTAWGAGAAAAGLDVAVGAGTAVAVAVTVGVGIAVAVGVTVAMAAGVVTTVGTGAFVAVAVGMAVATTTTVAVGEGKTGETWATGGGSAPRCQTGRPQSQPGQMRNPMARMATAMPPMIRICILLVLFEPRPDLPPGQFFFPGEVWSRPIERTTDS